MAQKEEEGQSTHKLTDFAYGDIMALFYMKYLHYIDLSLYVIGALHFTLYLYTLHHAIKLSVRLVTNRT